MPFIVLRDECPYVLNNIFSANSCEYDILTTYDISSHLCRSSELSRDLDRFVCLVKHLVDMQRIRDADNFLALAISCSLYNCGRGCGVDDKRRPQGNITGTPRISAVFALLAYRDCS